MNYRKKYLNSFGEITEEEKEILKRTWAYRRCELADEIEDVKKVLKKEMGMVYVSVMMLNSILNFIINKLRRR